MFKNIIFIILIFILSCSDLIKRDPSKDLTRIESENHILKKRLILLERKNSVVEEENIQYKKNLKENKAKIVHLESTIKSLTAKYTKDIQLWEQKYTNLDNRYALLEKQSSEKIKELTELNKKQEIDFNENIKNLNEEIRKKESNFAAEIGKLKKEFTQKESDLLKRIEELNKAIVKKDIDIVSLEMKIKELNHNLEETKSNIEKKDKVLKGYENKIEELNKIINEKESLIKSNKSKEKKSEATKEIQK